MKQIVFFLLLGVAWVIGQVDHLESKAPPIEFLTNPPPLSHSLIITSAPQIAFIFRGAEWVLVTNWSHSHSLRTLMMPEESNITTHYERGSIVSNLLLRIEYKGTIHVVILDTVHSGFTQRSYVDKQVRVYSP